MILPYDTSSRPQTRNKDELPVIWGSQILKEIRKLLNDIAVEMRNNIVCALFHQLLFFRL